MKECSKTVLFLLDVQAFLHCEAQPMQAFTLSGATLLTPSPPPLPLREVA